MHRTAQDGASTPHPAGRWAILTLLAVVTCIAAYVSATYSLAQVLTRRNAVLAHALAPYDGRITALLASSLATPEASDADRLRADRLARNALRWDPTAVVAVSTLGFDAQVRGDTAAARRLFAYSQALSRRDLQTQIWGIEDAVGRGDIAGALRHYDIALRTVPTMWQILFPVLSSATSDSAIRGALVRTLKGKPRWDRDFIDYIAVHGPDPQMTMPLFVDLRRAGVEVPESASTGLVNALIARGDLDEAWNYYASIRRGTDRRMSRDPYFIADLAKPSPLDWAPVNDAGISTSIQRGERSGLFDFAASASVGGPLLRQLQVLPSGDYQLDGHSVAIDQIESARPYWALNCQNGREIGRVVLPNSNQADGHFTGRFSVPAGCPTQMLVLVARPSDAVSGLTGQIDRVQLAPVR